MIITMDNGTRRFYLTHLNKATWFDFGVFVGANELDYTRSMVFRNGEMVLEIAMACKDKNGAPMKIQKLNDEWNANELVDSNC